MSIWKRKTIDQLIAESSESEKGLKRTLTAWSLIALGIGAIIGSGLFVSTASAIAQNAGPSVTISFIIAAVGCALAGLCYAELSSSIPASGSAYTYTYATMGELLAWIIGWDLILEYAVGAATVGIAWSEYLNNFLVVGSSQVLDKDIQIPAFGEAIIDKMMIKVPLMNIFSLSGGLIKAIQNKEPVKLDVKTLTTIDIGWKKVPYTKADTITLSQGKA